MHHNTLRKIVPVAAVAAAASVAIALSQESGSTAPSPKELREHAARIADNDTGCYDFGHTPLSVRTEVISGVKNSIISIPIRDSSTHEAGQDDWVDQDANQGVNLLDSGFIVSYSTIDGARATTPVPGLIKEADGTTPQSTEYNLEVGVSSDIPGARVADISYAADIAVNGGPDASEILRGTRLCGRIGYNVETDGSITDLRVLKPTDEVGRLHVAPNPNNSPLLDNWYL